MWRRLVYTLAKVQPFTLPSIIYLKHVDNSINILEVYLNIVTYIFICFLKYNEIFHRNQIWTYIQIYLFMGVYVRACLCICVCIYVFLYSSVFINNLSHIFKCIFPYTCFDAFTYTHTNKLLLLTILFYTQIMCVNACFGKVDEFQHMNCKGRLCSF